MKLTEKQISSIAQDVDGGMKCCIHKKTGKINVVIAGDPEEIFSATGIKDPFNDELEKNYVNYIVIEKMDSNESYRMMEKFVDTLSDEKIAERLVSALNGRKPFRNFNDKAFNQGVIEDWYVFKQKETEEYVKIMLENELE